MPAAAEFVPAPEHALIAQLAPDEPRVFEATGAGHITGTVRLARQSKHLQGSSGNRPSLSPRPLLR